MPLKIPGQKQCALRKVSTMGDGGPVSTTTSLPLFSPEQIQNLSENQRLTTAFTGLYATLSLILGVTPAAPEAEEQSGE